MTSGQPARSTTGAVAADHARLATAGTNALVATALRTKSLYAREIVAERAWPGHTPAELDGWAAQQPSGLEPEMDPRSLMDYARLVAVQVASQENRALARIILALAVGEAAEEDLKPNYVELLLNLHVVLGERTAALSLLNHPKVRSDVRASSEADLMNPWSHADQEPQAWFAAVERLMNTERLLPLTLMASDDPRRLGEDTLFDRLTVQGAEAVTAPAKVTIIMSAFKPGLQLLTAVRSAMAQTWSNIELLVIDDGSGPEYAATLDAAGALDSRVRVIRKAVNGGTYRARNTALRQLTGDFVMVLDSDDYLHPQAVEVLVRPLLKRDHLLATRAMGVRVSENLEFTRPGYRPRFTVATSLMFRFAGVVSRIGFFDTTYKGADTEYLRRMEAAFGPKRLRDISEVLTIVRGGDTLSAAEFSNGWRHGARHEYKSSYGPWHKQIATGLAVLSWTRTRRVSSLNLGVGTAPPGRAWGQRAATTWCSLVTGDAMAARSAQCWKRSRPPKPQACASASCTLRRCGL
ncbi:glycosyltransferase family 2 protein [Ornithinimicrobium sp. INDO-MA30-4]|uniref:glycosyltransferase family 2 protein n=1 Tax=Ornithinimicrobium sp. INDO-MA30-4 TaxID=2908651 RepID=UPI001F3F5E4C|nr:glycosyltransferase family 2 protein [Ornithinimicrobium sp. INDO-MA30-4]UJH70088.1 glycosyltransferase [Ornithinimicrobium sp. INDO-MA30-4]